MDDTILYRTYRLGDDLNIVEVLKEGFKGWPKFDLPCTPLEHWRWKYLDNPLGNSIIQVALSEDRVVGARHSYPLWIRIAGKRFFSFLSADIVVHSNYRKRGISSKLIVMNLKAMKENEFQYAYYVTSNPIMHQRFEKLKRPRFPHPILNLVLIYDIDKQLEAMPMDNAWIQKYGYKGVKFLTKARELIRGPRDIPSKINTYQIHKFDSRHQDFIGKIHEHYEYIVEKSIEYLNWRFCDSRAGSYIIHEAESNGEVLGYCVTRVNRFNEDYPVGIIVELLALPGKLDAAHALAQEALRYLENEGVNIVTTQVVKNHPNDELLKAHGFVDSRSQLYIYCQPKQIIDDFKKIYGLPPEKTYYSYSDIDSLPSGLPKLR